MELDINEKVKNLIKITGSTLLISYILYSVGPYKIFSSLMNADLRFFIVAVLIAVFRVGISARKWQILLRAKEEAKSFFEVWKVYYIGTFFNMFLPTNVGGDVVKAHKMSKSTDKTVEAYSSVFMERFLGLVAVLMLATVSVLFYFDQLPLNIILLLFCVFLPLLFLSIILIIKKEYLSKFKWLSDKIFDLFNPFSIKEKLEKLYNSINLYRHEKRAIFSALLISLLFHSLLVFTNYILALSVGMSVNWYFFFIFIPLTAVLLFLPISIKGFGVRDVIYVYFFTQVGATAAQAVSLSFLVHLLGIVSSIFGGIVYIYDIKR